jgi:hypothetical protein
MERSEGSAEFRCVDGLECLAYRIPCLILCDAEEEPLRVERLVTLTDDDHLERQSPEESLTLNTHHVLSRSIAVLVLGHTVGLSYACGWLMLLQSLLRLLPRCQCDDFDGGSVWFYE